VGWGQHRLSLLADAMMDNQCPKRLAVAHTPEEALASALATGIRVTTALEAITLHLSDRTLASARSR
jgi:hypothetical protein